MLEIVGLAEKPHYRESDLESALLDHLQSFLLELGAGFWFEARQKRIPVGNEHDYIDLVFYHRLLRCHLLIDLKVRTFKHGDAGQMNFYLNYWKANELGEGDNPPVGLLLCSGKEMTKVEYATGGLLAKAKSAAGVKGVLIRTPDNVMVLRVYHDLNRFTDYEIKHDDLSVTIDADALAVFYKVEGQDVLDHSPGVLGSKTLPAGNRL